MKFVSIASLVLLMSLGTGCNLLPNRGSRLDQLRQDIRDAIPDGKWATVDIVITGKFTSTTIKGVNVVKEGDKLSEGELHIIHSNPWVTLVRIDTTGYTPLVAAK